MTLSSSFSALFFYCSLVLFFLFTFSLLDGDDVIDISQLLMGSSAPVVQLNTARGKQSTDASDTTKQAETPSSPAPQSAQFLTAVLQSFAAMQDVEKSMLPLMKRNYESYRAYMNELDDKGEASLLIFLSPYFHIFSFVPLFCLASPLYMQCPSFTVRFIVASPCRITGSRQRGQAAVECGDNSR